MHDLLSERIISDGDLEDITSTTSRTLRNKILHLCLKRKTTTVTLLRVCDIMIDNEGNPRMKQFGEDMKSALETGRCCVWVNTDDMPCVCLMLLEGLGCMQVFN